MTEISSTELGEKEPLLDVDDDVPAVDPKAESGSDGEAEEDTDDTPTRSGHDTGSRRRQFIFFALFVFVAWLAYAVRLHLSKKKPQIIYATRYSKEHRYRPAASPIITETLKDGRLRLRGATPPPATPTPTPTTRKRRTRRRKDKKIRKTAASSRR